MNRPGFPGECFICELRLPDHRFRWKHNKLFLLLPEEYGPAFPTRHSIFDHEERQIISVNVSVVTNNNSVLHFFGLRPAHVAIRCHFPDSFLLYGVV